MMLTSKFELAFSVGLMIGAAFSFTVWHEPGCGVLMIYFALRTTVYGS